MGAGLALPSAGLLFVSPSAFADETSANSLRFIEDDRGMTVVWRTPPTKANIGQDKSWTLFRRAFGFGTTFLLAPADGGAERGYELEVVGARFGTLGPGRLRFELLRQAHGWRVRLRTTLWVSELVSNAVSFEDLCDTADGSRGFKLQPRAGAPVLAQLFEGHLRMQGGALALTLQRDGVWHVSNEGGTLSLYDAAFSVGNVQFAWCDPKPEVSTEPGLQAGSHQAKRDVAQSAADDPIFCAVAMTAYSGRTLTLARVAARPMLLEASQSCACDGPPAAPQWTYTRNNWHPSVARVHGVSRLRTRWTLALGDPARRSFGPLAIEDGVLESPDGVLGAVRFYGRVDRGEQFVESRIGGLLVRGTQDSAAPTASLPSDGGGREGLVLISASTFGAAAQQVDLTVLLLQSDLVPTGGDHGLLRFRPSVLELIHDADPARAALRLARATSYLWLGDEQELREQPMAHLDLTRARLEVARAKGMASLGFEFSGLHLDVSRMANGASVSIGDSRASCRVLRRALPDDANEDAATVDTGGHKHSDDAEENAPTIDIRPVLVVEFPPQHVFEETLVNLMQQQPPDIVVTDPTFTVDGSGGGTFPTAIEDLLSQLDLIADDKRREEIRRAYRDFKLKKAASAEEQAAFQSFATRLSAWLADPANLPTLPGEPIPPDQKVYIGPLGFDPDVAAAARRMLQAPPDDDAQRLVRARLDLMLDNANKVATALASPPLGQEDKTDFVVTKWIRAAWKALIGDASAEALANLPKPTLARKREQAVESAIPEYQQFRSFYRDGMVLRKFDPESNRNKPLEADDTEYFSDTNFALLQSWYTGSQPSSSNRLNRISSAKALYSTAARTQEIKATMRARSSGGSRLAFDIECGGRQGVQYGIHGDETGTRLDFSFDALTDWARFDLAVVPRARQRAVFSEGGVLQRSKVDDPAKAASDRDNEDVAMLRSLGMRAGRFVTAAERLADVEASLTRPPTMLQTSIELPARLILSPSQHALWRTRRAHPSWVPGYPNAASPLWTAELALDGLDPLVRAVHSPDLRPGFVRGGLELARLEGGKDKVHTPYVLAPPRGPAAPWTLGIEDGDPTRSSLTQLIQAASTPGGAAGATGKTDEQVCSDFAAAASATLPASAASPVSSSSLVASGASVPIAAAPVRRHPLIEYLCGRRNDAKNYREDATFPAPMDAYDRHEVVLLSSAFGLPVRGKREVNGQLQVVKTSSQVEMPEGWQPIDIEAGSALYRPRALNMQELVLSSLGGTLRHGSDFVPPSAARHLAYGPLYDSLSVERWQHWTVLGRDVFVQMVYKGYLFPIGHRASLVKQTDRVFLRPKAGGRVRAYLRQRLFIRVGQPDKNFPAPGQPAGGRQFPTSRVRMLTVTSPDLVDPSADVSSPNDDTGANQATDPSPSGRIFAKQPGLVFWPRVARATGAEVRFELQFESATTRSPLIFVDNTAVNSPGLVANLVDYYNIKVLTPDFTAVGIPTPDSKVNSRDHKRTFEFNGQSLRYCDEEKSGSASHKTSHWTLKATGGQGATPGIDQDVHPPYNEWEGSLRLFDDPSLEGAEQPPFYPALQTARLRLEQVERMSGGPPQIMLAQPEGWYVRYGFAAAQGSAVAVPAATPPGQAEAPAQPRVDPLQIYLNILGTPRMDMGAHGDQSGGVFRPGGSLVAVCRARGPLTGQTNPQIVAGSIGSVATSYSVTDAPAPGALTPDAALSPASLLATKEVPKRAPKIPDTSALANTCRNFFGLDYKILGLVTLGELVGHLDMNGADTGLPLLQEVVQYGIAGAAEQAGADVQKSLREQVINPLYGHVQEFAQKWHSTRIDGHGLVGSLADVFPDVDLALSDLLKALQGASQSDGVAMLASLAGVYECGRRLVDALARAAANPLDRVQLVLRQQLTGFIDVLASFSDTLTGTLVLKAEDVVTQLLGSIEQLESQFGFPADRLEAVRALLERLQQDTNLVQATHDAISKTLQAIAKPVGIKDTIKKRLSAALDADSFDSDVAAKTFAANVGSDIDAWLALAEKPLEAELSAQQAAIASSSGLAKAAKAVVHVFSPSTDIATLQQVLARITAERVLLSTWFAINVDPHTDPLKRVASWMRLAYAFRQALVAKNAAGLLDLPSVCRTVVPMLTLAFDVSVPSLPIPSVVKAFVAEVQVGAQDLIGRMDTLVKAIHLIADTAHSALGSAALDPKTTGVESLREDVAAIGVAALMAETELQEISVRMRDALQLLDPKQLGVAVADDVRALRGVAAMCRRASDIQQSLQKALTPQLIAFAKDVGADALQQLVEAARVGIKTAVDWLGDFNGTLVKALTDMAKGDDAAQKALKPVLDAANSNATQIQAAHDNDDPAGTTAGKDWLAAPETWWPLITRPNAAATTQGAENYVGDVFLTWISAWSAQGDAAATDFVLSMARGLGPVAGTYTTILDARAQAWVATKDGLFDGLRGVLLIGGVDPSTLYLPGKVLDTSAQSPETDLLYWEAASIAGLAQAIPPDPSSRAQALRFLVRWVNNLAQHTSAPERLAMQIRQISIEQLRAELLKRIDFGAIREQIEDEIKRLIPTAATLSYDFDVQIESTAEKVTGGIFKPSDGCALSVHTTTKVDLLNGLAPSFSSVGKLGAFDISLIGPLKAVTLRFNGVTFESSGGPFKCNLMYEGFQIGPELEFLNALESFFNQEPGSGFYLQPLDGRIGIEAGYSLNVGTISIANLAFFNISLNAAARLPFDDSHATFVTSLSRRDSPFTIAIAPYGGSGFFALEADTRGIVGFEASFEYGGAGAFAYGPLKGQGRVMTGIYLRSTKESTQLSATFFVGGSASIWIFNFGASLYVCANADGDRMVGDATFTFSFSVGWLHYSYHVTVHVSIVWGKGGDGSTEKKAGKAGDGSTDKKVTQKGQADEFGIILFASADVDALDRGARTDGPSGPALSDRTHSSKKSNRAAPVSNPVPKVQVDTSCASIDWGAYLGYFDTNLSIATEEF